MSFTDRLSNGLKGATIGSTAVASLGGNIVSGVCPVGGSIVGPLGNGITVGSGTGVAVISLSVLS